MSERDYVKRNDVLSLQRELRFDNLGIEELKHYRCRHIDPLAVMELPSVDEREIAKKYIDSYQEKLYSEWGFGLVPLMRCENCKQIVPKQDYCGRCGQYIREYGNIDQ